MAKTKIMILLGSFSDSAKMIPATKVLKGLDVPFAMLVTSAHRTPERTRELVKQANAEGFSIFICGAGMAAHLAGAVAACTVKPVIAVPLTSESSPLGGVDALLSSVQMPPGIPVATVAIDASKNAAFLALQILAIIDPVLKPKLLALREGAAKKIKADNEKLQAEIS